MKFSNAIGAARLGGMEDDLNLKPNEFQVSGYGGDGLGR